MLCKASRLGFGKSAEGTACFASAEARRESYAFVNIAVLDYNESRQAKLELFKPT